MQNFIKCGYCVVKILLVKKCLAFFGRLTCLHILIIPLFFRYKSRANDNPKDEVEKRDNKMVNQNEKEVEKKDEEVVIDSEMLIVEKAGKFKYVVGNKQLPLTINQPPEMANKKITESLPSINCHQKSTSIRRGQFISAIKPTFALFSESSKPKVRL